MKGKSSANTIITQAVFNRAVCLASAKYLNSLPILYNVLSIRHGLKQNKVFPKKDEMPKLIEAHLNIQFPYIYNKKQKIKEESYDMADACAVGLFHCYKLTRKKMNNKTAFETLGIPENSSLEDAKKAYKRLTKEWHPDVSKHPNAEEQFKKINEAYSKIQNPDPEPKYQPFHQNPFHGFNINFNDFFINDFSHNKVNPKPNITISHHLSFKESIFGTAIPLKINKTIKCQTCNRTRF